jgi:hypothetical protein
VAHAENEGGEECPAARQELSEEGIGGSDDEQPDERMKEPHVEEVDASEELSEVSPDDEEQRGPAKVVARPEQVDVRGSVGVHLRGPHDGYLVRADLDRPAVDCDEVERGEGEH